VLAQEEPGNAVLVEGQADHDVMSEDDRLTLYLFRFEDHHDGTSFVVHLNRLSLDVVAKLFQSWVIREQSFLKLLMSVAKRGLAALLHCVSR